MNVDELGVAVLGGSLVLLLAVGAVRLSTRTGTPSLLLYLGLGILLGETGLGIAFELRAHHGARLRRPRGDPGRGRPDHAVVDDPVGGRAGGGAGDGRHGGVGRRGRARRPPAARAGLGAGVPARRGPRLHRRRGGVLGAARGAAAAPARRDARGRVGLQRRARGHPRGRARAAAGGEDLHNPAAGGARGRCRARRRCRDRAGARLAGRPDAPQRRPAVVGPVPHRGAGVLRPRVRRRRRSLHTSGFLAVYLAALVLGNPELPHRPAVRGFAEGSAGSPRSACSSCSACSSRRPSCRPDRARPGHRPRAAARRPAAVGAGVGELVRLCWRDQAFLSWAGLRGAVPIVLATVPVQLGGAGTEGMFELVFVLVVVFTLVQAPTLPRVARRLRLVEDTAQDLDVETAPLGAIDAQVLTVGRARVEAARRGVFELRLPTGPTSPWSCATGLVRAGGQHPAPPRRPAAGRLPRPGAPTVPSSGCTW